MTDSLGQPEAIGSYYKSITDTTPVKDISLSDLIEMVKNPSIGAKKRAAAITPYQAEAKTMEAARNGLFYCIVIDHDDDNKTAAEISTTYDHYNLSYLAFTTSSHQQEKHGIKTNRWKIILPLAQPLGHEDFLQLSTGAALMFGTDPAQARPQQVYYAPNKISSSAPYEYIDATDRPFIDLGDLDNLFVNKCLEAYKTQQKHKQDQANRATPKPSPINSNQSIIEKVCNYYDLTTVLQDHGYKLIGKKLLSPQSRSGDPGVIIMNDGKMCYSHHGTSDPLSNLNHDGHALDTFAVICLLDYQNDISRAVSALAEIVDSVGQKERQIEHMETKDKVKHELSDNEPLSLDAFVINDLAEEMEAQMLEDKFVLGRMAILGQSTVFYAKPNAGKTLLVIWLLMQAIKAGEINGEDVYYINADDTHKGLVHKTKLAKKYGFKMMAPGYLKFKVDHLPMLLQKLVTSDEAKGKILVLDTVKKFTDLMKKSKASQFGEYIRQFVLHGGTVIMLAHVNKHRDDDNKVIYSGTTDLVDDADCAYTLDTVIEEPTGLRTVKFENFKARGDVTREAVYRYDYADGTHYNKRLESIQEVGKEERQAAEKQKRINAILERNRLAVDAIKDCIHENVNQKTRLIGEASERSGLSKKQISKALLDHTGSKIDENQFWHVNKQDKNAHVYQLNYGIS